MRRGDGAGNHSEFAKAVHWVSDNLSFDLDGIVSVFETNIRVMGACCCDGATRVCTRAGLTCRCAGGLLAAHLLASDASTGHAARAPRARSAPAFVPSCSTL